ncbi:hypothetical protein TNIN_160491 [Trichonephila inaurata madagascariensis]|uniref:Uncharacterized protein n=1 Tax=Trichonephila inaurata madagascariensis TaxID=2747483 RepID=A0A8X6X9U7_9ARAC|nr:hypothetical protein TNIN_160491 [Trichonephila inaurata madagascariensis]
MNVRKGHWFKNSGRGDFPSVKKARTGRPRALWMTKPAWAIEEDSSQTCGEFVKQFNTSNERLNFICNCLVVHYVATKGPKLSRPDSNNSPGTGEKRPSPAKGGFIADNGAEVGGAGNSLFLGELWPSPYPDLSQEPTFLFLALLETHQKIWPSPLEPFCPTPRVFPQGLNNGDFLAEGAECRWDYFED